MSLTPRHLPSIDTLRQFAECTALQQEYGQEALTDALRDAASDARRELATNPDAVAAAGIDTPEALASAVIAAASSRLASTLRPSLLAVINATGVIVHTNLGRAPLAEAAITHVARVARSYTNLEFDLEAGGPWAPRRPRRSPAAES